MRLAISYNCFTGIELLPYSIKQIRSEVDYIQVVWQKLDYFGKEELKEQDYNILQDLKNQGLIDDLVEFKITKYADNIVKSKLLEKEKRNLGRNICLYREYDYFMTIDCDELYETDKFKWAKELIVKKGYEYTYCNFINYYKEPIYRNKYFNAYVNFISVLNNKKKLGTSNMGITIDPTRGYVLDKLNKSYIFNPAEIYMHHMTAIRSNKDNLKLKYKSSSLANLDRNNIDSLVDQIESISKDNLRYKDDELEIVENKFNIAI